jgi:hypothetical protein
MSGAAESCAAVALRYDVVVLAWDRLIRLAGDNGSPQKSVSKRPLQWPLSLLAGRCRRPRNDAELVA